MGHSEAGMQILHYACKHPERVSGLVLLTTVATMDEQVQKEIMFRVQRRKDQPWFAEAMKALQTEFTSDEQLKTEFAKMLPLYWSDTSKIASHQEDFEAISWSAEAWRGQRESKRFPFDLTGQLKQVKAPPLIVVGDDDITPPESAKRLHLCLPNSKLLVIEKAGHFPWLERPDIFFQDVPEFLKALNLAQKL
jgi:proline iminopeptidase